MAKSHELGFYNSQALSLKFKVIRNYYFSLLCAFDKIIGQ